MPNRVFTFHRKRVQNSLSGASWDKWIERFQRWVRSQRNTLATHLEGRFLTETQLKRRICAASAGAARSSARQFYVPQQRQPRTFSAGAHIGPRVPRSRRDRFSELRIRHRRSNAVHEIPNRRWTAPVGPREKVRVLQQHRELLGQSPLHQRTSANAHMKPTQQASPFDGPSQYANRSRGVVLMRHKHPHARHPAQSPPSHTHPHVPAYNHILLDDNSGPLRRLQRARQMVRTLRRPVSTMVSFMGRPRRDSVVESVIAAHRSADRSFAHARSQNRASPNHIQLEMLARQRQSSISGY